MTPRRALPITSILALACACATPARRAETPPVELPNPVDASAARGALGGALARADLAARTVAARPVFERASASLSEALGATDHRIGSTWRALSRDAATYEDVLAGWASPEGSLSLGSTSRGTLVGSVSLPLDGAHHAIVSRARERKTNWATRDMVDAILDVSRVVAGAFPGSKLAVGNMSYRQGGDIKWSVSHNSGRDADLAFYVLDPKGRALAVAPDLISFDDSGLARDGSGLRFDVPRNWELAKALIMHEKVQLQYLFISTGLKAKLLAHAERSGEPEWLLERARGLLHQPTDSSPHDDHFHLRLTCNLEERLLGCLDVGPRWSWVDWHRDELLARVVTMAGALDDPDPGVRAQALEYLRAIRAPHGPDLALARGVFDDDEVVRDAAVGAAAAGWTHTGAAVALAQRALTEAPLEDAQRRRIWSILRTSRDPWVVPFARERMIAEDADGLERARAARALSHHMLPDLVPFLLERVEREDSSSARAAAAQILRRITNRAEEIDWSSASASERAKALTRWRRWWEESRGQTREIWLVSGFEVLGLEASTAISPASVDTMIGALDGAPEHLVYNINRTLREITGRWSPLELTDGAKLKRRWTKWWKKNRRRFTSQT